MTEQEQDADRFELISGSTTVERKPKSRRPKTRIPSSTNEEPLLPHLDQPVPVKTPDFSNPDRAKTCLEVDFPILPINALSRLEGNAGKPIYQMSKWWARRRSCVFRAMLIAASMEARQEVPGWLASAGRQRVSRPRRDRVVQGGLGCLLRESPGGRQLRTSPGLRTLHGRWDDPGRGLASGIRCGGRRSQPGGVVRRQERTGRHRPG